VDFAFGGIPLTHFQPVVNVETPRKISWVHKKPVKTTLSITGRLALEALMCDDKSGTPPPPFNKPMYFLPIL